MDFALPHHVLLFTGSGGGAATDRTSPISAPEKRDYLSDCARKKSDTSAQGKSNVCSVKSFLLHAEDSVGHMDVVLETKWTAPHVILDTQCNNIDLSETYNHQVQHM